MLSYRSQRRHLPFWRVSALQSLKDKATKSKVREKDEKTSAALLSFMIRGEFNIRTRFLSRRPAGEPKTASKAGLAGYKDLKNAKEKNKKLLGVRLAISKLYQCARR